MACSVLSKVNQLHLSQAFCSNCKFLCTWRDIRHRGERTLLTRVTNHNVTYWNKVVSCNLPRKLCRRLTSSYGKTRFLSPFTEDESYDIHHGHGDGPVIVHNNEAAYFIIGGGVMGLALAFNLWRSLENFTPLKASKYLAPKIVIVERDPSMSLAATPRSVGSIRQQFSHPSNIQMSMASSEFLRNLNLHLGVAGHDPPNIQFQPQGYLFLASESGAEQLMKNYSTQINEGAKVMLLSKAKLKETFPWINVDGIELATYGLENEGWFDPWCLMNAFKTKIKSFGAEIIHGDVVGFKKKVLSHIRNPAEKKILNLPDGTQVEAEDTLIGAYVKVPDHDKPIFIKTHTIINCAGPWAGEVADMAGLGPGNGTNDHPILEIKLPVKPSKRYVYSFHCPDGPIFDCPLLVDPAGTYVRRDGFGGMYVAGMSPTDEDMIDNSNLDVDYDFFNEEIWPRLAHRVPVFERLKLKSAWAGYYDYNTFDQNAIIGPHPYYTNFSFLNGFSGHGIQMAYSASACLAGMLTGSHIKQCENINAEPFSFNRFLTNTPMREINIV